MNSRLNIIVINILNRIYLSIHEYADYFNVSEQTIRNDINDINKELTDHNLPKITINNSLVVFEESVDISKTVDFLGSMDLYKFSTNERRAILAMILLNSSNYLNATELSEKLLVSKNTIFNDINYLKDWFAAKDIIIDVKTRGGYLLESEERTEEMPCSKS